MPDAGLAASLLAAPPLRLAWLIALGAAFALAAVLRVQQAHAPLVFDEYASLYFSGHPLTDLWGPWMLRETNPPLFYSLLTLWRALVPADAFALRVLPLAIALAQIGLVARFAWRRYGPAAAVLAVLLLAVSVSDIYQSPYLRGYGLARLGATISFIGLVTALEGGTRTRRGWAGFVGGAVLAIHCHTTMLLWPPVAVGAVVLDAALAPGLGWRDMQRAGLAAAASWGLSLWVIVMAALQLHGHTANINWIEPLDLDDFVSSLNLQLLLGGTTGSLAMLALAAVGAARTFAQRETRLGLLALILAVSAFKACDAVHPIISDFTLHWAAQFTTLLAAAALAPSPAPTLALRRWAAPLVRLLTLAGMAALGPWALANEGYIPRPQDWQSAIRRVAQTPGGAMLVSHESIGVIVQQACMLEYHAPTCPFPLVVMANPSPTDNWSFGGYRGVITPPGQVRQALGRARTVFAFSRYVYTPLAPLGLDPGDYGEVEWDDGELIGPIPIAHFDKH